MGEAGVGRVRTPTMGRSEGAHLSLQQVDFVQARLG
jgi:hypothetical protein